MSNKGKYLKLCPECKRKRYCTRVPVSGHNFRITCSKGHAWIIEGITVERLDAALCDVFSSDKLTELFNRDDVFYRKMNYD